MLIYSTRFLAFKGSWGKRIPNFKLRLQQILIIFDYCCSNSNTFLLSFDLLAASRFPNFTLPAFSSPSGRKK